MSDWFFVALVVVALIAGVIFSVRYTYYRQGEQKWKEMLNSREQKAIIVSAAAEPDARAQLRKEYPESEWEIVTYSWDAERKVWIYVIAKKEGGR